MTKRVLANHAPMMKRIAAQRRRYLSCLEAIPLANAPQANDDILPAQQGKLTHPTKGVASEGALACACSHQHHVTRQPVASLPGTAFSTGAVMVTVLFWL